MGVFDLLRKMFIEPTPTKPDEKKASSSRVENNTSEEVVKIHENEDRNPTIPNSDVERNRRGIELEKRGEIEKAIELYELSIAERFEGNHPYESLANIYRERKQYNDEMRVLEQAVDVFEELERISPRQDVSSKLQRFRDRIVDSKIRNDLVKEKLSNGLYPGEVILIDWMSGKSKNTRFPKWFYETYDINAEESLNKLVKEGYLSEGTPFDSLASLKVSELKELLKTKQLKVSGKKAELISRIKENYTEEEVELIRWG